MSRTQSDPEAWALYVRWMEATPHSGDLTPSAAKRAIAAFIVGES